MSRHFDPPYGSPLEEAFAWNLSKVLGPDVHVEKQFHVQTPFSSFFIDLVLSLHGTHIGIELDGEEFHTSEAAYRYDYVRDALILNEGGVRAIYRVPGKDAHHTPFTCLDFIRQYDQELFSERGVSLIAKQKADEHEQYKSKFGREMIRPMIEHRNLLDERFIISVHERVKTSKAATMAALVSDVVARSGPRTFGE